MTRIIAEISVFPGGFVTGPGPRPDNRLGTGGEAGQPASPQRSVIPASTATHLTYDVFR